MSISNSTLPRTVASDRRGRPVSAKRWLKHVLIATWAVATLAGFGWMATYSYQHEESGTPPLMFSEPNSKTSDQTAFKVLFFLHPQCPCSWASARELKKAIEASTSHSVSIDVYVFRPSNEQLDWAKTSLASFAGEIKNATLKDDPDGRIATKFGVTTSGTVVVYNPAGELEFVGGVTSSRGHEGDSLGSKLVADIVCGIPIETHRTPVFGCRF